MGNPWWYKWREEVGKKGFDFKKWQECYNQAMHEQEGIDLQNITIQKAKQLISMPPVHPFIKGNKILDVGCGYGLDTMRFAKAYPDMYFIGIDIANKVIDKATELSRKAGLKNIKFKVMSAEKLKFKNNNFDTVMCYECIEHVYDLDVVMTEMFRVLKPCGVFTGSTPWELSYDGGLHLHYFSTEQLFSLLSKYGKDIQIGQRREANFLFMCRKKEEQ